MKSYALEFLVMLISLSTYRYYTNKLLSEDKEHPDYVRARFPAHEIEQVVECTIRDRLSGLIQDAEDTNSVYFLKHHMSIPAYDLVRALTVKVVVHYDKLVLNLKPTALNVVARKYLNIVLTCEAEEAVMQVPYISERAQDGAVVIKSDSKDPFDLPPKALKKFVQGVIWRDEHFEGMTLKAIARREGYSQDYVDSAIFYSFKVLQNAM